MPRPRTRRKPETPLSERIKILMSGDKRTIKAIAEAAGVDYQSLRRWHFGMTKSYDVDNAAAVFKVLTGEGL